MTNQEIIKKFLNGFNKQFNIQESLELLSVDYRFKNPMIELKSKDEFIKLVKDIGNIITSVNIIATTESGDTVATLYEFHTSIPGLERNIASEWFRMENGLIKESHLIYDASQWRRIYEEAYINKI